MRQALERILDALLVPTIAFIIFFRTYQLIDVSLVVILAVIVYFGKNVFIGGWRKAVPILNGIDLSILLLLLADAISFVETTNRVNSFYQVISTLLWAAFYLLVRLNLNRERQRTSIFIILTVFGSCLAYLSLMSFISLDHQLRELGFSVIDFRNRIFLIGPSALFVGEWSTIYLAFLPFPIVLLVKFRRPPLARAVLWIAFAAISLTLFVTLIRAIYIAAFVFLVAGAGCLLANRIFSLKQIALFCAPVLLILAAGLIPVAKSVAATVMMFKTTSQVRSAEGRVRIWRDVTGMVKDNFWFGVGGNNFPLQYLAYRSKDEDSNPPQKPFNFFLHLLIEKGMIGLLAYLVLLVNFFRISYQNVVRFRPNAYLASAAILFAVAYFAILVRDLSESSILLNTGVNTILCLFLAYNSRMHDELTAES